MPSTNLQTVQKRVISILMANRLSPYAGTIPTPASNSRYQDNDEIKDAALEADTVICQARITTPGDPHRNKWISLTADLASGVLIPEHTGAIVGFQVKVGSTYTDARFTSSRAEVLAMRTHPTLYPNAQNWGFVEEGMLYHNGDFGRIWRSNFTKSDACQSPEEDQTAVIAGTLGSLPKDGSVTPEIYTMGARYFEWYIQTQIKGQPVALPEIQQIEQRLAA